MKHILVFALAGILASAAPRKTAKTPPPSYDGYVVAVDQATMGEKGWKKVVDALKRKHRAKVVTFAGGKGGLDRLVAELAKTRPMYVCFVLRPESAGREFVQSAHEAMRRVEHVAQDDIPA